MAAADQAAPGPHRSPHVAAGRSRCATRQPGVARRRSATTIAGLPEHPQLPTAAPRPGAPPGRHPHTRRTGRAAARAYREPAARARATGPRCGAELSNLWARLADLTDLDGRRASRADEGDHP